MSLVSTPTSSAGESRVTRLPCSASQSAANIAVSLSPKTVTSSASGASLSLSIATASIGVMTSRTRAGREENVVVGGQVKVRGVGREPHVHCRAAPAPSVEGDHVVDLGLEHACGAPRVELAADRSARSTSRQCARVGEQDRRLAARPAPRRRRAPAGRTGTGRRASAARLSCASAGLITHWVVLPLNIQREMHSFTAIQRRTRSFSPRRVLATISGSASPARPSATKSNSPSPTDLATSSSSQTSRPTPMTGFEHPLLDRLRVLQQ